MVTVAGTVAIVVFELEIVTTAPPGGADASSVTVMLVDWPPRTRFGENRMLTILAARMFNVALSLNAFAVAVISAWVNVVTAIVVIVKLTDDAP